MSDLNKFQSSEAWRNNLKNFLTMQRSTKQLKEKMSEDRRLLVVDVDENLKKLLEKKKKKSIGDDFTSVSAQHKVLQYNPHQHRELQQLSDESFEALELMCDKTASDPNSTLFKYLHADQKEQILAKAKIRNVNTQSDIMQDSKDLLEKLKDCTLLDDIEAPSNLWENTVSSDNILYTSPIKMVGFLRPSTIIEETMTGDYGDSQNVTESFNNVEAKKCNDQSKDNSGLCSSSAFQMANFTENNKNTENLPSTNMEATINKSISSSKCNLNDSNSMEVSSENETSLDTSVIEILSDEEGSEEVTENVCEVSKDQPQKAEEYNTSNLNKSQSIKNDCLSREKFLIDENEDNKDENENNKDEDDKENRIDLSSMYGMHFNDTLEEVDYMMRKGEEYMTKKLYDKSKAEKKRNSGNQHNEIQKKETKTKLVKPATPLMSSKKITEQQNSVTSNAKKIVSPQFKVPLNKKLPSKCNVFDVKPIPKFNLCVKPSSSNKTKTTIDANSKEFNKKHFGHIVSPIGTYVKKTATAPLMMDMKPRQHNNLLKSKVFRTLEYDSRLHTPTGTATSTATATATTLATATVTVQSEGAGAGSSAVVATRSTVGQKTLSKKAYISSGLKHIVDERSPITIPGGQKVQKYLESAIMPAVLKHEGKIKLTDKSNYECLKRSKLPTKKPNTSSNVVDNTSMANLSVMSGDLSLYTMTDARKF